MTDYIKREDALKAVDAFIGTDPISDRIKLIPSADVAPVVRCKDCTYYCPLDDSRPYDCLRSGMLCVRKDDFCSCGKERR